jgi:DNA-binding IclR family transcriptional regulator
VEDGRHSKLEKFADVIGLVWRADRTVAELVEITGKRDTVIRIYLKVLQAEGLVVRRPPTRKAVVYGWAEKP